VLTIDGSYGEGGGQIIRTCLSLSAITRTPVRIINIRAHRPKPGLWAQHLSSALAAQRICNADTTGLEIKSTELSFAPGRVCGGEYQFDIGTAGSVTLVAQTIIPILLCANTQSRVQITGGTHVFKSPGFDYFQQVFVKALQKLGANIQASLIRPGYYPKGGGLIELNIQPSKLTGNCRWPRPNETHAIIRYSKLPQHIVQREKKVLQTHGIHNINICQDDAFSPGNSVTIWQGFCGAYAVGERGKPAEQVANEAITDFKKEKADVDRHLADQLLIYAVMAKGESRYSTSTHSTHFKTNMHVIKQFYKRNIELNNADNADVVVH